MTQVYGRTYNQVTLTHTHMLGGPVQIKEVIDGLVDTAFIYDKPQRYIILSEDFYQALKKQLIGYAQPFFNTIKRMNVEPEIKEYRGIKLVRVNEPDILLVD